MLSVKRAQHRNKFVARLGQIASVPLRDSPAAQNISTESATGAPASPAVEFGPIADTAGAIFAPIMASLKRIEEYVDTLPDKPTGSAQVCRRTEV